jgi:hypothetical protein
MSSPLTLPDDQKANVPLIFKDAIGVVHAPPSGGSVVSDNEAVATASVAADDASVDIVSVADGTCNVTYTNGSVSDTIAVTVATPTPTSVALDPDHATFSAR